MTSDLNPSRPAHVALVLTGTQKADMIPARKGETVLRAWIDEDAMPALHRAYVRRVPPPAGRRLSASF
jgi:hypothetical protein